jgi:hypothetical protein
MYGHSRTQTFRSFGRGGFWEPPFPFWVSGFRDFEVSFVRRGAKQNWNDFSVCCVSLVPIFLRVPDPFTPDAA